jgi:hypothetical protein
MQAVSTLWQLTTESKELSQLFAILSLAALYCREYNIFNINIVIERLNLEHDIVDSNIKDLL